VAKRKVAFLSGKYFPVLVLKLTRNSVIGIDYNDLVIRLFDRTRVYKIIPYERIYGNRP
jgi:hypothetical protein